MRNERTTDREEEEKPTAGKLLRTWDANIGFCPQLASCRVTVQWFVNMQQQVVG